MPGTGRVALASAHHNAAGQLARARSGGARTALLERHDADLVRDVNEVAVAVVGGEADDVLADRHRLEHHVPTIIDCVREYGARIGVDVVQRRKLDEWPRLTTKPVQVPNLAPIERKRDGPTVDVGGQVRTAGGRARRVGVLVTLCIADREEQCRAAWHVAVTVHRRPTVGPNEEPDAPALTRRAQLAGRIGQRI